MPRYWMGIDTLLNGIPLVVLVLGFFALPEAVMLAMRGKPISSVPQQDVTSGLVAGMRDVIEHRWLMLRSSMIGVYMGLLPALGATVAEWAAYGHAVQSAKDRTRFGKGDVRGVIAPETANNSVKGGDLVPTVAFGIPGSAPMAILLGAFLIQGLTPGPEMLTTKLAITYSMVWTLVIANVAAALLLALWVKQLQRIIFVPGLLIVPAILVFVLMGSWNAGTQIGDWVMLLVFGLFGIALRLGGWPRAPMVLGFILGPIMENSLHLSVRAYGASWIWRPICLALAAAVAFTLIYAVIGAMRRRRARTAGIDVAAEESGAGDARVSLGLSVFMAGIFVAAIVTALPWPATVSRFPLAIAVPALLLGLFALWQDVAARRTAGAPADAAALRHQGLWVLIFVGWLGFVIAATVLVGQLIALPLFVFLFLLLTARTRWWAAGLYAAAVGGFLYVMFDQVVGTIWYPGLLFR
jgi:hypothetical protein